MTGLVLASLLLYFKLCSSFNFDFQYRLQDFIQKDSNQYLLSDKSTLKLGILDSGIS